MGCIWCTHEHAPCIQRRIWFLTLSLSVIDPPSLLDGYMIHINMHYLMGTLWWDVSEHTHYDWLYIHTVMMPTWMEHGTTWNEMVRILIDGMTYSPHKIEINGLYKKMWTGISWSLYAKCRFSMAICTWVTVRHSLEETKGMQLNNQLVTDIIKQEACRSDSSVIYNCFFGHRKFTQSQFKLPLGSHIWSLFAQIHMEMLTKIKIRSSWTFEHCSESLI